MTSGDTKRGGEWRRLDQIAQVVIAGLAPSVTERDDETEIVAPRGQGGQTSGRAPASPVRDGQRRRCGEWEARHLCGLGIDGRIVRVAPGEQKVEAGTDVAGGSRVCRPQALQPLGFVDLG